MNFAHSERVEELRRRLTAFMAENIYPNEHAWHAHTQSARRWETVPIIEELKPKAREAGLWNLWRPKSHGGTLGNVEYALGERAAAERAFRRASEAHPQSAAAFNNLAHVLAESGRLPEAEQAARRAVALGGPLQPQAQETLQSIERRRAARP